MNKYDYDREKKISVVRNLMLITFSVGVYAVICLVRLSKRKH